MTAHDATQNARIVLAARPRGEPAADDFRLEHVPLPVPGEGQVLLRNRYLSLDPYMRGRMNAGRSYARPVELGQVMEGGTVSEVIASRHPDFRNGDMVLAHGGWQTHAVADGRTLQRRLDARTAPLTTALGVYGMPGFTAYVGLHEIGKPQPGETVVVAAASGPVGATVGQIARLQGARAVGIAGGEAKRAYLRDELGFDVALDHRAPDFADQLRAACPDGIDVYFENVGGAVFDAVVPLLNDFARIPVCGLVAHYNDTALPPGPDRMPWLMSQILTRHLTVRGFIQHDFIALYPQFLRQMGAWLADGKIRYREDIVEGLENAPRALIGLLRGENFGKVVVKL
ncbi:NADP-dependent oxidoreductase [Pseudoxanthomonas sp. F37]|uniref:NADP-dependent oxidoreductase n=1 Tax=Pseudoxanthomonas TaxID=83618 RepID=UPI001FD13D31|nr:MULTISPECIES: NADP-dependent oxidoreductase [Pseudoxanthomonas]UOV03879.1 NADP-dependent oxidoreductase [Pseudoxanthomonas mexicana]UOV08876.1 NADP-dependent oxidoreductase [Pseudoxanthomonas sp. F37]